MMRVLTCRAVDGRGELRFRVLATWRERMRGLLGTNADAEAVTLVPCASVHTLFMRYAIDVAFVGHGGVVVASRRAVPPGRLVSARGAYRVLERPTREGWWPEVGTRIRMTTRLEKE